MKLIVGLGNPGSEYENTRHNLGFIFVDHLVKNFGVCFSKQKFQGLYTFGEYKGEKIMFLKPLTFMNNSGECIKQFLNYFQIDTKDLLIVYDELALLLGSFRYRERGSSGGHNGVKNIIDNLGNSEFKRLRLGIGSGKKVNIQQWVLQKFNNEELVDLKLLFPLLTESIKEWISSNHFDWIMGKYNKKNEQRN